MRQFIIAGNWKMNKNLGESRTLAEDIKGRLTFPMKGVEVVLCPPFTSLESVGKTIEQTPMRLGGQNMSERDEGAFTGEISASMLFAVGCTYVILGHSERRQYCGETDESINKKVKKALVSGLVPIVCVGETLEQREKGITTDVVAHQTSGVLKGLSPADVQRSVLAYEPVWAIGTGKTATPAQAEEVHSLIRGLITKDFGNETAARVIIQYGGSVKPDNATELLQQADIDGALVGGACLKADSFAAIIKAAADIKKG